MMVLALFNGWATRIETLGGLIAGTAILAYITLLGLTDYLAHKTKK